MDLKLMILQLVGLLAPAVALVITAIARLERDLDSRLMSGYALSGIAFLCLFFTLFLTTRHIQLTADLDRNVSFALGGLVACLFFLMLAVFLSLAEVGLKNTLRE